MFKIAVPKIFRAFLKMSYCEEKGKDKIVFVDKSYNEKPSKIVLKEFDDDYNRGLIHPNGDINFNCPCLGGMASGPCGLEFREAFSCFHYSTSEVKGSECVDKFIEMQNCMTKYPKLYSKENDSMNTDSLLDSKIEPDAKEIGPEEQTVVTSSVN